MAMYKSPIAFMLVEEKVQMEKGVLKTVQDVGINVDKTELLKALAYDREQYQKGFADGREAGREWISVDDRLPDKVVTGCLVYADGWTQVADWTHDKWGIEWWFYVDGEYDPEITHWMPLPEPPKEE